MDVRGNRPDAIPGQYIIGFKPEVTAGQRDAFVKSLDARHTETLDLINGMLVVDPERALTEPNGLAPDEQSLVKFVQPNYRHHLREASAGGGDPEIGRQYHLENRGQTGGTRGADVKATEAWRTSTGEGVVVAVADTNIDINHPDLVGNIWTNEDEVADNGKDDDGNGFVDDVHGWNFSRNSNRPQDGSQTHGTHVAGIIGATADNGVGGAGTAPDVRVMPLTILGGGGATSNAIKAWGYAVKNGANVISNSWGNNLYEPALQEAVTQATNAGAMVVVAAGNENWDTGVNGSYPDNYAGSTAIAASDHNDRKASYSNRGQVTIDIAAPGDKVHSTLPGGRYGGMSGTSMAAPVYSGVAALVKSAYPELTMKQVEERIFKSAQKDGTASEWNDLVASGGRADAVAALTPIATPSNVAPTRGSAPSAGRPVTIGWQARERGQTYDVEASLNAGATSSVSEDFESGAPSRTFRSIGNSEWVVGSDVAHSGKNAFNVNVGRGQQSRLELTETLPEDTEVAFRYRAGRSGELSFFVDRNLQFQPTTSENWREFRATIPAGEHTFTWLATGRRGSTGTFGVDDLQIGAVSDSKWQSVGTTDVDDTSIAWKPGAASDDARIRVRADNGKFKGDWAVSEPFQVRPVQSAKR